MHGLRTLAGLMGLFALLSCNETTLEGCTNCCQRDPDCSVGTYCGPAGMCIADCGPAGPACPSGTTCNAVGRCVSSGGGGGADAGSCASISVRLTPVVPRVLLLIDQSGSMTEAFGTANGAAVNRWEAVHYALTDAKVGAVAKLQDRVLFGASLYYSNRGNMGGTCPILTKSAGPAPGRPLLNNRGAIDTLMTNNKPVADTPTAESVKAITADAALWGTDPGPKVLVLATDGDPDTCADPDASGAAPQGMSEQAVQAAYQAGIRTYVLSVGTQVTQSHLQKLANAGVGLPLTPPSAPAFTATTPADLVTAFNTIIKGTRSCKLTLNGQADPQAAAQAVVKLNGQALKLGTDWRLADPRTIELLAGTCDTFLGADTVALTADFPCGSVIIG